MELAPRYCRSCGSRILVKNVCHNCNKDPIKGDNYCYDCGALTPNTDGCLKCGAKYKRTFPIKAVLVIGSILIIAGVLAAYFLSAPGKSPVVSETEATITQPTPDNKIQDVIVNNMDTSQALLPNPLDSTSIITVPDSTNKVEPNIFFSEELKRYKIRCSYFKKNQKSQVLFFIGGGLGFIKMNGKIYELKRKRKGVDLAVFGSDAYEATIIIDGLGGNAREWLASCTLIIKDLVKNTSSRHKVYSPCIEL